MSVILNSSKDRALVDPLRQIYGLLLSSSFTLCIPVAFFFFTLLNAVYFFPALGKHVCCNSQQSEPAHGGLSLRLLKLPHMDASPHGDVCVWVLLCCVDECGFSVCIVAVTTTSQATFTQQAQIASFNDFICLRI
ncbi:hypothetical protein Q5P01_008647 [Channa striata]|uniref:Uncharacterized protein n=1 Tax=Channa striata TaxID=64152 RepID=A0AA88N749_CHASR|nr:hypothetical protein Q5P01_008647 [Channa striata]